MSLKISDSVFWEIVWLGRGSLTTRCLAVTGDGSVGECDRLSQPGWLLCALVLC